MKILNNYLLLKKTLYLIGLSSLLSACSSRMEGYKEVNYIDSSTYTENKIPGTVDYVWEEKMLDIVTVPGQIDPSNVYYRPKHHAIYEIRQGRVQHVEFPEDAPREKNAENVLRSR